MPSITAADAQPAFRLRDTRPKHDNAKLAKAGIHKYESKRLCLYTDIDPNLAQPLPALLDQMYDAWESHFGKLPPAEDKSAFQVTGYLMKSRDIFRDTGLLPQALPGFSHGRHSGYEFWMNDQPTDYYRRHLLLHEATHCFMTALPTNTVATVWYFEGMAEFFATHTLDGNGRAKFAVMPHDRDSFSGLGRIKLVLDDVIAGQAKDVASILSLTPDDFAKQNSCYGWSWALCKFLDTHPRYRERLRSLLPVVRRPDPKQQVADLFAKDWPQLQTEWILFLTNLCHGYDIERAAIDFKPVKPLASGTTAVKLSVAAGRGWQSTGVSVQEGDMLHIIASGRFALAKEPKPWVSEPQGVSIRYHQGQPLGKLLAIIVPDISQVPAGQQFGTSKTLPIGREAEVTAPVTGTLFLRVNDFWNELADNAGEVAVEIRP
ncbi:MAG: hypothetical protein HZA46_03120 [Planctomycetales bacterium]|nr:hypothetical protein [Planctomycetales bacterium]